MVGGIYPAKLARSAPTHSPSLASPPCVQVPHPWSASMAGAPGGYPWVEEGDSGRPMGLLVPNPAAPDDPRCACPHLYSS